MIVEQLKVKVENSTLVFQEDNGENCTISFHRTLRLPMDGKIYPLPPSFGLFPVQKVEDYADKVPESWKAHGGIFFPMFQREAMWMDFKNKDGKDYPFALKVAVGKVNAITGEPYDQKIKAGKQDYVVIPDQAWLDGINGGEGIIKQFVAMPLGGGYTVEAQVTGEEKFGGIQMVCFPPKIKTIPKKFDVKFSRVRGGMGGFIGSKPKMAFGLFGSSAASSCAPPAPAMLSCDSSSFEESESDDFDLGPSVQKADSFFGGIEESKQQFEEHGLISNLNSRKKEKASSITKKDKAAEMGLSAGGKMKQKIVADPKGAAYWDEVNFGRVYVHIVNSELYYNITGSHPPPTPIDASAYTNFNYPWYDLYEENSKDSVPASSILGNVKNVKQVDQEKYAWPQQDDKTVPIPGYQVKKIVKKDPNEVTDGDW